MDGLRVSGEVDFTLEKIAEIVLFVQIRIGRVRPSSNAIKHAELNPVNHLPGGSFVERSD
jgi:hypothetical protein